jgi:hypothetical protein
MRLASVLLLVVACETSEAPRSPVDAARSFQHTDGRWYVAETGI